VRGGPESAHVAAGLGDDHGSAFAVDTRNRDQVLDRVSERGELGVDPRGYLLDDRAQLIDAAQDDAAEERVVVVEAAGQRLDQRVVFEPQLLFGQISKDLGVAFTVDEGLHHRSTGDPEDVGGHHG